MKPLPTACTCGRSQSTMGRDVLPIPGPCALSASILHPLFSVTCPGSSLGEETASCPSASVLSTSTPGPWGSPASSPEPSSPESVSRNSSARPSPLTSGQGSPQLQSPYQDHGTPRRTLDAPCPVFLTTDGTELSSQDTEEAEEAIDPCTELTSEDPASTIGTGASQPLATR